MQKANTQKKLYPITAEDIKVFDERRKKRLSGECRTYSWEEAKAIITQNKKHNC